MTAPGVCMCHPFTLHLLMVCRCKRTICSGERNNMTRSQQRATCSQHSCHASKALRGLLRSAALHHLAVVAAALLQRRRETMAVTLLPVCPWFLLHRWPAQWRGGLVKSHNMPLPCKNSLRVCVCMCVCVCLTYICHVQEKEDWINAVGRAIVKHSRR